MMKKVLFALIALFSFVGVWAEDAPQVELDPATQVQIGIGDNAYTVTLSTKYVALFDTEAGVAAPTITSITKGDFSVNLEKAVVKVFKQNKATEITGKIVEEDQYFLMVSFDEGIFDKVLWIPFYVIEPWDGWTRVNDYNSFEQEYWWGNGVYDQYYEQYPWCDVWCQTGQEEAEGVILYPGNTFSFTDGEVDRSYYIYGDNTLSDEEKDAAAKLWADNIIDNQIIKHSWYATQQSNPDNIVFSFEPMLAARVVNSDPEDWNSQDNVINGEYGTCRVVTVYNDAYQMPWGNTLFGGSADGAKRYGLMTVDEAGAPSDQFDESKFAMLLVPSNEAEGLVEEVVDFANSVEVVVFDDVPYNGLKTAAKVYSVTWTGETRNLDPNDKAVPPFNPNPLSDGTELSKDQYYIAGYVQAEDVNEDGSYNWADIKEYPSHVGQWVALVAFGAEAPEVGDCANDGSIWNYDETGTYFVGYAVSNEFTVNPAPLVMRLSQITPHFGQKEIKAKYAIEPGYYKEGDDDTNVIIINETYKGSTANNTYGETADWYYTVEWWNDPKFNKFDKVKGAAAFDITDADRYSTLGVSVSEYTITSAQAHPCTVIGNKVYENYYIAAVTDAQCKIIPNKVTIVIPEGLGKLYGDVDPDLADPFVEDDPDTEVDEYEPGVTVVDMDGTNMLVDYEPVQVTISRAKEGKYEDAGYYAVYVDITGENAGNYEVVGKQPDVITKTTDGKQITGLRYIYEDAFEIWPYDISEEEYDWDKKIVIEIDDVTYNGTCQQVKPKEKGVKFLDVNNVLSAENTTNEYVAGTEAVEPTYYGAEDPEVISGEKAEGDPKTEGVAATPAYVLLAENTDWVLAYLNAETGKGTQWSEALDASKAYTYFANGRVRRDAEWNVMEKVGQCHIEANEGSINFFNDTFGYFTVKPRPVHLKAVMADDPTTADVDESTAGYPYLTEPKFTLEEVETEAEDDGFVLDEIQSPAAMDNINSNRVMLVEPNVVFDYNAETMKNVGTYTVKASLNPDRTNKKIPYDYTPIFDDNNDNLKVIKLVLEIASVDQDGYYKSMNGDVEMNPAVDADKAEMHKGVNVYTYVRPQIDSFPRTGDDPETAEVEIQTVSINSGSVPASVNLNDLVKLEQTTTKVGSDKNTIVISLKNASVSENYDITLKSTGNFNIAKLPEIHLSYDGDLGQALEDHKGQTGIDVYLPKRNLFENVWSSFVLPFEVNVPELSHKLYYGLVNTLNTAINDGDVHFIQQAGDIDPNTPFLFKIGVKKNWADPSNADMYADVKQKPTADADPAVRMKGSYVASQYFAGVTIADVPTKTVVVEDVDTEVPVEAGDAGYFSYNDNATAPRNTVGNNSFIGVYNEYHANADATTVDETIVYTGVNKGDWFLGADGKFYGGENNLNKNVAAVSAFVNKPVSSGAAPRFFFDEGNGTVTAIDGVLDAVAEAGEDAEGAANGFAEGWYTINGIKLEGEPTTTGTYIYNGKKVFIQK